MCGIAGYWSTEEPAGRALLRSMCDRLNHRGPDAYGEYFDGGIALGHRRLSIIDVSGGAQPLPNEDGSVQVVFNGEIYNFLELRRDLVRQGHRFATHSDTEVLVHLYEDIGWRLPELLNGMFALAIWDRNRQELFLARDRFGKKPLYYTCSASDFRIAFASELKALTILPGFSPAVNARAVADFLTFSYVPDPETIYETIHKLPPGHSMTVNASGVQIRKYWQPEFGADASSRFEDEIQRIHELAQDCVERRMIADVPLGAFLSGGVDSSAVVGFMARKAPGAVKTFSIGFTDPRFDESQYARETARLHQTDHREEILSDTLGAALDEQIEYFDEPFGDSSAIPMLHLSRMTRKHVTVALSGDGADEIFGGYRRYRYAVLEERLREKFPSWFRQSVFQWGGRYYPKFDYLPQVFRAKTLLGNLARELGEAYFVSMSVFRDDELRTVLSSDMNAARGEYSPRDRYCERFGRVQHLSPLEQMQAVDFETYLPGDILVKADRATMAHSLESRSPWLDYRLAELACRLPADFKVSGPVTKRVFKAVASPYVPEAAVTRRKMGFSPPLAGWFRSSLRGPFERLVLAPEMEAFCSRSEIRRLWTEHQSGIRNHDRKLWNLFMLAAWNNRYGDGNALSFAEQAGVRVAQ